MSVKLLQVNLNHACQAQHLFCHGLDERGIGLAYIAEPYRIPENNPNWVGDECPLHGIRLDAAEGLKASRPSGATWESIALLSARAGEALN